MGDSPQTGPPKPPEAPSPTLRVAHLTANKAPTSKERSRYDKERRKGQDDRKHERKWDRSRSKMRVPVLSSLLLFHARQADGEYHSLLPSGGGPRTHTGDMSTMVVFNCCTRGGNKWAWCSNVVPREGINGRGASERRLRLSFLAGVKHAHITSVVLCTTKTEQTCTERCGLVVDTWPRDQEVPGSSPSCARSTLSPCGWYVYLRWVVRACISYCHGCGLVPLYTLHGL